MFLPPHTEGMGILKFLHPQNKKEVEKKLHSLDQQYFPERAAVNPEPHPLDESKDTRLLLFSHHRNQIEYPSKKSSGKINRNWGFC